MKKRDWMIIGALMLAALGIFVVFQLTADRNAAFIRITIDGEEYKTISIGQDAVIDIEKDGHTNTLQIQDGMAQMLAADCPDQLCVQQSAIGKTSEMGTLPGLIVCLPNGVIVERIDEIGENEMDSVAQ